MVQECDVSEGSTQRGTTPLMFAVKSGVRLRNCGTRVNSGSKEVEEIVSLLLKNGAHVNRKTKYGPTALRTGRDSILKRPRARSCCSGPGM